MSKPITDSRCPKCGEKLSNVWFMHFCENPECENGQEDSDVVFMPKTERGAE